MPSAKLVRRGGQISVDFGELGEGLKLKAS